jgi:hypothetical protein
MIGPPLLGALDDRPANRSQRARRVATLGATELRESPGRQVWNVDGVTCGGRTLISKILRCMVEGVAGTPQATGDANCQRVSRAAA